MATMRLRLPVFMLLGLTLAGCALQQPAPLDVARRLQAMPVVDVLLLGEQHDAPDHQDAHRQVIEWLAARGRLAAVALEMAEQGTSTSKLAPDASEAGVRSALRWDETGWPWQSYGPAVMAAVRNSVPVIGGNLPRSRLRPAMVDAALDGLLPGPALEAQQQAIRLGHCGLLPETQIGPMTRVQIARDRAMAQTLAQAASPGKTVVLIAGKGHVDPMLGVPRHLPPGLRLQTEPLPPRPPQKDYCEEMRGQMKPAAP
jgi:uncharacterized iron-regulated protein